MEHGSFTYKLQKGKIEQRPVFINMWLQIRDDWERWYDLTTSSSILWKGIQVSSTNGSDKQGCLWQHRWRVLTVSWPHPQEYQSGNNWQAVLRTVPITSPVMQWQKKSTPYKQGLWFNAMFCGCYYFVAELSWYCQQYWFCLIMDLLQCLVLFHLKFVTPGNYCSNGI